MTDTYSQDERYILHAVYLGRVVRTMYFDTLEAAQNFSRAMVPAKYGVDVWHKGELVFTMSAFLPECGH